jgi:16S rRNA (guanine966-N2)-methyltransferase
MQKGSKTVSKAANQGQVRIISGAWRRLQLPVAPVEGLRPTPDRVRETLFNWLGQDCQGWRVLDVFAGTGALGFEAASRGAALVHFVEMNRLAAKQLEQNKQFLLSKWLASEGQAPELHVQQADALGALKRFVDQGIRFDWVVLDPPFRSDWLSKAMPLVMQVLQPNGLLYIEWHENLTQALDGLEVLRHLKAGQVHAHLCMDSTGRDPVKWR